MEAPATIEIIGKQQSRKSIRVAAVAWVLMSLYFFYQYALRSAPSIMMPELSNAFNISALGVASMVGLFYYGYSPFSLIAGMAMDRIGARRLLPGAAAVVGIGALLFATGNRELASVGRSRAQAEPREANYSITSLLLYRFYMEWRSRLC